VAVRRADGVVLRPAGGRDHDACARLYYEVRRRVFHWEDPASITPDDYGQSIEGEDVWVAERGGRILAFVSIYRPDSFVHSLFVDPAFEGRGIGRDLLEAALGDVRGASLKCVAANHRARAFYQRLGWVEESRGNDRGVEYVLFRR
jgi:GNAT superfamily N-acetyltransferase